MVLIDSEVNLREQGMIYAQTIQNGLLPKKRHFKSAFKDHFIIYKPQDNISGDFYWLTKKEDVIYFAMADCTGHGTAGAMLSVLGISLLNYVTQKKFDALGDYLTELDKKWIETFNNDFNDTTFNNDWLEITLISFNTQTHELQYSCAGGEFAIYQNNNIQFYKGNNYPIGGWQIETSRRFDTHKLVLEKDAKLYFFSDGVKHQFNQENNKKFSKKRLSDVLKSHQHLSMQEQQIAFEEIFNQWKGNNTQTDDVSVVGIEV